MSDEPLCSGNGDIFVRVERPEIERLYRLQRANNWPETDIDFATDEVKWPKISLPIRRYIMHILSFSLVADGLVNCNILTHLFNVITDPSATAFLAEQIANEIVHQRTYSLMLSRIVHDSDLLTKLRNPLDNFPGISLKIKWVQDWITEECSLSRRLVGNALLEGVSFSSLFGGFDYLKHMGLGMSGLITANGLIARDEDVHCVFSLTLLKYVVRLTPREEVEQMVRSLVTAEIAFIEESLPEALDGGLNADVMIRFVKFSANRVCRKLLVAGRVACGNIYSEREIGFIPEWLIRNRGVDNMTLFFDYTPIEYRKVSGKYSTEADF